MNKKEINIAYGNNSTEVIYDPYQKIALIPIDEETGLPIWRARHFRQALKVANKLMLNGWSIEYCGQYSDGFRYYGIFDPDGTEQVEYTGNLCTIVNTAYIWSAYTSHDGKVIMNQDVDLYNELVRFISGY